MLAKSVQNLVKRQKALERKADRLMKKLYSAPDLFTFNAVLAQATELETPLRRVRDSRTLMQLFREATSPLYEVPAELTALAHEGLRSGIAAASEMIEIVSNPFNLPPEKELEYAELVSTKLQTYWGKEQSRMADEVQARLTDGLERGMSTQQLAREIKERVQVSRSRATLIARNELGNASAYGQQVTQEEAGITHYEWVAASDERVRPEHAARNGKIFAWSDPPADGHPGQPIQCRCVSVPVFPASIPTAMSDQMPQYLDEQSLPADILVGNDRPLRGSNARIVVGDTRRWLEGLKLPGRRITQHVIARSDDEMRQYVEEGLKLRGNVFGVDIPAPLNLPAAVTEVLLDGRIAIGPRLAADLEGSIAQRARGFSVLAHEYWHGKRLSDFRAVPKLEEGLAELFAEYSAKKRIGYQYTPHPVYQSLTDQARKVLTLLGDEQWEVGLERAFASRSAPRLDRWLWDALEKKGLGYNELKNLLGYIPKRGGHDSS